MVLRPRIELGTPAFSAQCSTDLSYLSAKAIVGTASPRGKALRGLGGSGAFQATNNVVERDDLAFAFRAALELDAAVPERRGLTVKRRAFRGGRRP